MDLSIAHKENGTRGVFYIEGLSGIISELTYQRDHHDVMTIDHTETKRKEQGKGMAGKLVKHAVQYARENKLKIEPLCPYAEVQFDKHPEYADVRA